MSHFRRVIALVLAALWLPAVWHCGLETLGTATEEQECCSHEDDAAAPASGNCVADHCGVFDEGHFKAEGDSSIVAQPPALVLAVMAESWFAAVRANAVVERGSWPPPADFSCGWMFEQRAAPMANAPGLTMG